MKYLANFIVLYATWVLLAGTNLEELLVGFVVALILAFIIAKNVNYDVNILLPVKLVVFIFVYIPVFVYKLILANLDIARRVLSIKIPLNPGIVKVNTDLKTDFGKLTLANLITLTPGTLTLDVESDQLYIHCVDVKNEEDRNKISKSFEKVLGVIFK